MLAALLLDHRLAFVFLCALVLGAAVPLAFGWARVLPEEPPPFPHDGRASDPAENPPPSPARPGRDPLAILFLLCVTLSYAAQLPGLPRSLGLGSIPTILPSDISAWFPFALAWFFVLVPVLAVAYALRRPNFLAVPLIAAGALVFLLWLLANPLRAAMEAII